MSSTDKYLLAGTIVYLAIGSINMCVLAWQMRRADPERLRWPHLRIALMPAFWLMWPYFLKGLLPGRCEHEWVERTPSGTGGAYCMFCFRTSGEERPTSHASGDTEAERLPPTEYSGELLCARCGVGQETGNRYHICADGSGWSHAETCAIYDYGDVFVCPPCEAEMLAMYEGAA